MSFGVSLGTHSACQIEMWKPGTPASSTVGMSGADGRRLAVGDRIGLDRAGAHLRQRVRRLVDHDVDLPGDQVLHRRPGAAIGHELKLVPVMLWNKTPLTCAALPTPAVPPRRLVGVRLQPGDQLLQVVRRQSFLRDDQLRVAGDQRDRLEILQQVVRQRIDGAVDHVRAQWPRPMV